MTQSSQPQHPSMKVLEPPGIAFVEHTETALIRQIPWETLLLIEGSLASTENIETAFQQLRDIFELVDKEEGHKVLLIILRDIFTIGLARVAVLKQEREREDAELAD